MSGGAGGGGTAETNDDKLGIMHPKAIMFCALWYFFSSLTLFLNKYIVDMQKGDAALLGKLNILASDWCIVSEPSLYLLDLSALEIAIFTNISISISDESFQNNNYTNTGKIYLNMDLERPHELRY